MSTCMNGTRGSGVFSSTCDVLVRGVGEVCDMCMCLARGGVGGFVWVWVSPILWRPGDCWTCVCVFVAVVLVV